MPKPPKATLAPKVKAIIIKRREKGIASAEASKLGDRYYLYLKMPLDLRSEDAPLTRLVINSLLTILLIAYTDLTYI